MFWTGDNSPHDIWENTNDEIIMTTKAVTNMVKEEFAGADIPVFPILGNHDVWPVNV